MDLTNSEISAGCFVLTLGAFVGLQFAPHVSPMINDSLFSIMGLALGHALGTSATKNMLTNIANTTGTGVTK